MAGVVGSNPTRPIAFWSTLFLRDGLAKKICLSATKLRLGFRLNDIQSLGALSMVVFLLQAVAHNVILNRQFFMAVTTFAILSNAYQSAYPRNFCVA